MDATKLSQSAERLREVVAQQVAAEMGRHRRMSGKQLALAAGLPYRNLMRSLNAERPFTIDELARIAEALDVPISSLMGTPGSRTTDEYADMEPVAA